MLILVTGGCLVSSFLLASAVVPVPAMRGLGLQAAVLAALNLASALLLFPAMLALDLRRVAAGRADIACFRPTNRNLLGRIKRWFGEEGDGEEEAKAHRADDKIPSKKNLIKTIDPMSETCNSNSSSSSSKGKSSSETLLSRYARWLTRPPVKLLVVAAHLALTVSGAWLAASRLEDGLGLGEVVPRGTGVARFLERQDEHFGFYNVYAVTRGNLEYPQSQALLHDYHRAFVRVPAIVKDDDGGLPEFWLPLFRAWLARLQDIFDDHMSEGRYAPVEEEVTREDGARWRENATAEGILAYKLMVQTGHVDYPVDVALQSSNRLVDAHGVVNPSAFYNYLSAWYSNDAMAYSFSQAAIVPRPREWVHSPLDTDLRVPKSSPIAFAQIPFYLTGLDSNADTVAAVREIRELCRDFEERGLPNFPRGVPFTFWEQYLTLR